VGVLAEEQIEFVAAFIKKSARENTGSLPIFMQLKTENFGTAQARKLGLTVSLRTAIY
jgi:hypothetical protein